MHPSEFAYFSIENWKLLGFNIFVIILVLFMIFRRYPPAKLFDPFHFYFSFTMGTTYGIMITLYMKNYIENSLFWKIFSLNILLIFSLLFLKKVKFGHSKIIVALTTSKYENFEVKIIFFLFFLSSLFLVILVGPLIFYESRFEAVKGIGFLKRIFDVLRLFVIAYLALSILAHKSPNRPIKISLLLFIILYSSILNGAKFAFLESLYAIVVAVAIYKKNIKISILSSFIAIILSTIFAILVLYSQIHKNIENIDSIYGTDYIVLERFIFRILSNGNQVYMLLPNNVIEKIEVNNPAITLLSPLIGSSYLSKFLGYNVNDFNVGRQAILYYQPDYEKAGGPTSHFDLFAYKYFGYAGAIFFTIFIAVFLNYLRYLTKYGYKKRFMSTAIALFWVRGLAILLEPSIGIAHVLDIVVLLFTIKIITLSLGSLYERKNISYNRNI
ncbi:O-antigen polymerase [Persephonella sp.]